MILGWYATNFLVRGFLFSKLNYNLYVHTVDSLYDHPLT